jgi:hypothetical protein
MKAKFSYLLCSVGTLRTYKLSLPIEEPEGGVMHKQCNMRG